jgi:hypothetical protein
LTIPKLTSVISRVTFLAEGASPVYQPIESHHNVLNTEETNSAGTDPQPGRPRNKLGQQLALLLQQRGPGKNRTRLFLHLCNHDAT